MCLKVGSIVFECDQIPFINSLRVQCVEKYASTIRQISDERLAPKVCNVGTILGEKIWKIVRLLCIGFLMEVNGMYAKPGIPTSFRKNCCRAVIIAYLERHTLL